MTARFLYHFHPDPSSARGACGVWSGRANASGGPIDRVAYADWFARVLTEGRPVCEEGCRKAFDRYLEGRPGLARLYGLGAEKSR